MSRQLSALTIFVLLALGGNLKAKPPQAPAAQGSREITAEDCTSTKLGTTIPVSSIGEPVAGVTLAAPRWVAATGNAPAHCSIDGAMAPTDTSVNGRPINFRVVLPASWTSHAVQLGGGGMNGSIPNLTGGEAAALLQRGFAAYGSDSGHQQGGFGRRGGGAPAATPAGEWSLSDEAIKNLGYMQMKKTHDAAMVLMERLYGERPRYNYYVGSSQGGREALTVAQRYPADYNGIAANVPIVSFSSLMLAPEWIRIQEKPLANWVTPAKTEAIRAEFVRQCDKLDGLADGIINNYMACRAIFDMSQGSPSRNPWAAKRCPNNVDPNPQDATAAACFTDGQTNPDLSAFAKRGGKMIVAIGTNDSLASPGAQLDYYQSVLDTMGRAAVDSFARFYVLPQTGHGLTGSSYTMDGDGRSITARQIPSRFDRIAMLLDWVERGAVPPKSGTTTGNAGSLPLCSYPTYPRHNGGATNDAASYTCAEVK